MDALLRLVSLGSAARNTVKIKVRQPLAELKVCGSARVRRAVERFADQIRDELNIKTVTWHDHQGGTDMLLKRQQRANLKSFGPKSHGHIKEIEKMFAEGNVRKVGKEGEGGAEWWQFPWGLVPCEDGDYTETFVSKNDGWVGIAEGENQLDLDARITPALAREGMAREVIRHVQNSRKEANLQMEDRIVLYLHTDDAELSQAIAEHKDYITAETLVAQWSDQPLGERVYRAQVMVDGKVLAVELRTVG
jgi:isoleucyl-tRNA synthetase